MNDEKLLRFVTGYCKLSVAEEGNSGKRIEKGLSSARGEKEATLVTTCALLVAPGQTGAVKGDDATCQMSFKEPTTKRDCLPMNASYVKLPICTMKTVIPRN